MKRILFSVVFLLSLTLAHSAPELAPLPKLGETNREKVSAALQKVVAEETSHAVQELIDTYPDIIEMDEFDKIAEEKVQQNADISFAWAQHDGVPDVLYVELP